eukprot:ANDGO_06924.mRNA.1 putative WD repeat-containing protein alr2800
MDGQVQHFSTGFVPTNAAEFSTVLALSAHPNPRIYIMDSASMQPILVLDSGHQKRIDALCFSSEGDLWSVSADALMVWRNIGSLTEPRFSIQDSVHLYVPSVPKCSFLCISPNGRHVVLGVEYYLLLLDGQSGKPRARFEGHTSVVSAARFFHKNPAFLVSASEDGCYKVWDSVARALVFESGVESAAHPFVSLSVDPMLDRFSIGASDGRIRTYDIVEQGGSAESRVSAQLISVVDISKFLRRMKQLAVQDAKSTADDGGDGDDDADFVVVSTKKRTINPLDEIMEKMKKIEAESISSLAAHAEPQSEEEKLMQLLPFFMKYVAPQHLAVATPLYGVFVDMKALACENIVSFPSAFSSTDFLAGCVCHIGSQAASPQWFVSEAYQANVFLLRPRASPLPLVQESPIDIVERSDALSVHSPHSFPDHFISSFKSADEKEKESSQKGPKRVVFPSKNKPIVFHSKIRSTGYGKDVPWRPKSQSSKKLHCASKLDSTEDSVDLATYPVDGACISAMDADATAMIGSGPLHNGPIFMCRFSPDGKRLVTASGDQTLSMVRFSSQGKPKDKTFLSFASHKNSVSDVRWSLSSRLFISSANDGSSRIWSTSKKEPILIVDRTLGTAKPATSSSSSSLKSNPNLPSDVRNAQFYAQDRFIALTFSNKIQIYKYVAEEEPKSDLNRQLTQNRYKAVDVFQSSGAQQVSAFGCMNGFISPILFSATSARAIEIFDVTRSSGSGSTNAAVLSIPDAHGRSIHSIGLCDSNQFGNTAFEDFDLFLTSSMDNVIKLWDLRSARCVQSFSGSHQCRSLPVHVGFSPCMRFVATGSEDNSAYMYDRRTGRMVSKLAGALDSVSCCAFHPQSPVAVSASYDSKLRVYKSE